MINHEISNTLLHPVLIFKKKINTKNVKKNVKQKNEQFNFMCYNHQNLIVIILFMTKLKRVRQF